MILRIIKGFLHSLQFRTHRSLRWCSQLDIRQPLNLSVATSSNIRGGIRCHGGSLIVHPGASVGRGSEVSIVKGGTIEIGEQVMIGRGSRLNCGENELLSIGKGTTFYANVYLSGNISIGQNCLFGANISILTGSHLARTRKPIREQDEDYLKLHGKPFSKPVAIGDDCWIGNNAIILPGVSLPDGCVVGAGSVVTKSFEPYSIVVGNPARFLKMRE